MARARNIKPGFFKNEVLARLDPHARLLFAGLWTIADKQGRFEVRLEKIKAEIFPHEQVMLESCMAQLWDKQFLTFYEAGEKHIGQVNNWLRHQSPHHKELDSEIPECKEEKIFNNQEDIYAWLKHGSCMNKSRFKENASSPLIPDSLNLIPLTLNPSTSGIKTPDPTGGDGDADPPDEPEPEPEPKHTPKDYRLAEWILQGVLRVAPKTKPPNLDAWADTIRLMRERDKLTHHEIAQVFGFANNDQFWSANILSPGKLREQFAKLDAHHRRAAGDTHGPPRGPAGSTRRTTLEDDLNDTSWATGGSG